MTGVFLDRDGVLNEEVGHLSSTDQLRLLPDTTKAVRRLNDQGIPVIVVTNQSAIGRGLCSEGQVMEIHAALAALLMTDGARITRFSYCPHHPTAGTGQYGVDCNCRKPKPGMLHQAARDLGLDLRRSVMVGDQLTDLEAGWEAGCRTVLVSTGYGLETRKLLADAPRQPDHISEGLGSAVDWILQNVVYW